MDQTAVATSVPDASEIINNNNIMTTTNSLTTFTKVVTRPIKPTRKKRKATTVLAVGASRDTNRSLVGNTLNNVVDTTSISTSTGGISINEESTFTTTINNNHGVTDNNEGLNSENNHLLLQQKQIEQQLRPINSHLPLELIPPIIPENTTGKPTLRMFCSSYPKPKKPRRMVQLRTNPNTTATTNMTNTTTTTGTAVVVVAANTTTTPTDGATRTGNTTTTTTGWTDPSHISHTTITDSQQQSQPQHTGPVVQIVNGEIVLQESSMVFHGSVAMGNPNNSLLNGGGNGDYGNNGLDGNHYNNNNNNHNYHLNNNNNINNTTNHNSMNNNYNGGMTVVEEEAEMAVVGATYTSFATGRRARPKVSHWTVEETELFYEALQQVGLDFGTMEAYFEAAALNPNNNNNKNIRFRQRRQLKRKYQAEYNKNPKLIEKVLQCQGRVGIDLSVFHLSDDVVHNATESSESQLIEVNDNDGTTTSNERRNDLDTGASSSANQISQRPDNGTDRIKDPIFNNENDDNEMDTFPSEQNDETMYFEDGQQGDDQLNIPPILFNDTNKAKTSNNNVTVRHPPTIVTKPKAIRPIRSAATRIMAKNRVE